MGWRRLNLAWILWTITFAVTRAEDGSSGVNAEPRFSRDFVAVISRMGCNSGTCHGAVQGQNGFRLSLFGAKPTEDWEQIVRAQAGRRIDRVDPERSLLLLKATMQVPHGGGKQVRIGSREYELLRRWIVGGAVLDETEASRLVRLEVTPREQALTLATLTRSASEGEGSKRLGIGNAVERAPSLALRVSESGAQSPPNYPLRVLAEFADGSKEDVTALCSYRSLDEGIAAVDANGVVRAVGVGDAAIIVRFRHEPVMARIVVARPGNEAFPDVAPHNFVDGHVLAKLKRLNVPPSPLVDDATFLRRARLDITGQLPTANEVREFLADSDSQKRSRKIDQLLDEPGHVDLWTLKFCDLLGASDFGIYADGLAEHFEAPRFQAWVRARLTENLPYDEFAARILMATSREGRSLDDWAKEVVALQEGYATPRKDLDVYAQRNTLDIYWQRRGAVGVPGTLQIAHAFFGLRLECAQCHRHPHDVWQQDDLLSFANFFMRVRTVGFQGDNEKKYVEEAKVFKQFSDEGKRLMEEAKKLKDSKDKESAEKGRELERRGRLLSDDVAKRVLHAQILNLPPSEKSKNFASVTSPLGTQTSKEFRLLGDSRPIQIADDEDPRQKVVEWLRRPDNPFFARAIVNRVWAHYFGRGIIDPPDDLSPLNPATHPELLDELCRQFVANGYRLKWLHRMILNSRTWQQSSQATRENEMDRANYAYFYFRRLPAEVLLDALNQTTGTRENLDMKYFHWADDLKMVELPYKPRNTFVTFMLEQFGKSERNSSTQCDCQRQSEASLLQVLSFANHPRVSQKIADPNGRVAHIVKEISEPEKRIEELYLSTLGRPPSPTESSACQKFVAESDSPEKGLHGVLWSLLNTREFILQH